MTVSIFSNQILYFIKANWSKIFLIISFGIILAVFIITRLPFFLYYPLPFIEPDSYSYLYVHIEIFELHQWPKFVIRTPGYPLFISLILFLTDKIIVIILAQTIIIFISALFLVYTIYRFRPIFCFPAALAMAAFLCAPQTVYNDFSMMSESLYTSSLIFFLSSLMQLS